MPARPLGMVMNRFALVLGIVLLAGVPHGAYTAAMLEAAQPWNPSTNGMHVGISAVAVADKQFTTVG